MRGRIRAVDGHDDRALSEGWRICAISAGSAEDPDGLCRQHPAWFAGAAPATAAGALRSAGTWSLTSPSRRFDAEDWWWHRTFSAEPVGPDERALLCFDGLATLADVWLNGRPLLSSRNMFLSHRCQVELQRHNDLHIRFRAIDDALATRRPRPRWRTPMVEQQQLRWIRTTLLGRMPGWSPPAAVVGPWRPVRLEWCRNLLVEVVALETAIDGNSGLVRCAMRLLALTPRPLAAELVLRRPGIELREPLVPGSHGEFGGVLTVPDVALWWPHTHGDPALYDACVEIMLDTEPVAVDLGHIGFRCMAVSTADGDFDVTINGSPVFCRGACWTPLDPVTLTADDQAYRFAFSQVRAAGMNMLRSSGTMVYETDRFFDLADHEGVLLWQDFMFASMDYPEGDAEFQRSVRTEVEQLLRRLQGRPSVAVLCGNSEAEQQAALCGAPRELWQPKLFHETIRRLADELCPGVPYWPSSAHGGAFPHQPGVGTSSYYGVGAYLRPLSDTRASIVRFATECLAFANVPDEGTLATLANGTAVTASHPAWKARTPRDLGSGWDFDDVRDHYLEQLFGVSSRRLRGTEHERYLELSRVITGEIMAATFGEWRTRRSPCRGALVWFLRDLWTGPGWGIVSANGVPKACYYYLRRILQPVGLHVSDEGCNGLMVHLWNETAKTLDARLGAGYYRAGDMLLASAEQPVNLPPHARLELSAMELFDTFTDFGHAYRFGPDTGELFVATLTAAEGGMLGQAFHFLLNEHQEPETDIGLRVSVEPSDDDDFTLNLHSRRFARAIAIDAGGYLPDDNYFHLAPDSGRTIRLRRGPGNRGRRGTARPLNARTASRFVLPPV